MAVPIVAAVVCEHQRKLVEKQQREQEDERMKQKGTKNNFYMMRFMRQL